MYIIDCCLADVNRYIYDSMSSVSCGFYNLKSVSVFTLTFRYNIPPFRSINDHRPQGILEYDIIIPCMNSCVIGYNMYQL